MKTKVIAIVIGAGVLMAAGCFWWLQKKGEAGPSSPTASVQSGAGPVTPAQPRKTQTAAAAASKQDYGAIGFELIRTEALGSMHDGLAGAEVVQALGEPEEKSEATEWGADGAVHQTWNYPSKGIELDMIENEQKEQAINMITIKAPCTYRTKRGIGIGSKWEEVMAAYRNEIDLANQESPKESIVAGTIYGGVIFSLENDQVVSIFIGAGAE